MRDIHSIIITILSSKGKQSNASSTIESNLHLYDELVISSKKAGQNIEYLRIRDGIILKDLSKSLCKSDNWAHELVNEPVGDKITTTYTYEIKESDL